MTDRLKQIIEEKYEKIARQKNQRLFSAMDREVRSNPMPVRGFARAIQARARSGSAALIAEIKKASPSAGLIRPDFDPARLAKAYEKGGAACLSVLTDEPYFQGSNADLVVARAACSLPVLRKDFILDPWQVAEARAIGADCILLIMAAIDDVLAAELHATAVDYGMDVLIESHDKKELERALKLPSGLIGINNRNLRTLKTDLHTTEELAPLVPNDRLIVSESGIAAKADIDRLKECGAKGFLVGESLLRQTDVTAALKNLISPPAL